MNWNIVADSWNQLKGKAVAHWEKLDSVNTVKPKEEEVSSEIQELSEAAKDEAAEQIQPIKGTSKE